MLRGWLGCDCKCNRCRSLDDEFRGGPGVESEYVQSMLGRLGLDRFGNRVV